MPGLFSRFKSKDGKGKKNKNGQLNHVADQLAQKPKWEDAYARSSVDPSEVQELVRRCTGEIKARALDHPFLLLPFRPTSDPSAVRTFIRHFFDQEMSGDGLAQELRMTEPMVVSGVVKWCWSRLPGGVVGWDVYELFKVGEHDSDLARDSFTTFIPLSVDNDEDKRNSMARASIIFDFFELLAAIAAHGKMNGFGGRKLSRMASWWAFEHKDTGEGFEGGYKGWLGAADATSHLFFAYLRSMAPESPQSGISMIPMSLQKLLHETEYPPQRPTLMQTTTYKVVMIVDTVSPTPFSLLRRANNFQYRDSDRALQAFAEYDDPVMALTEECRRVLKSISSANQSAVSNSKHSTGLRDASWSRFEDIGFGSALEEAEESDGEAAMSPRGPHGLRTTPASGGDGLARPTTPSWADFLSSGFVENQPSNMLLPPDKVLPPIETAVRQRSSQSHRPRLEHDRYLEPGELANISRFDLDEAFWWVWMNSLAPEETSERKSAFGRCAVIETAIRGGRWLVMEEMVKGAAPEPDPTAYVAEKKSFFSWTKRSKLSRRKSTGKGALDKAGHLKPVPGSAMQSMGASKTSIAPDQQAKIQAAAQQLQARTMREKERHGPPPVRRGRADPELASQKTNSVFTLQPVIMNEASSAMKWATQYDKQAIREQYLGDTGAGRGIPNGLIAAANGTPAPAPETRPAVPDKATTSRHIQPPAPAGFASASTSALPISPAPKRDDDELPVHLSEKAIEAPREVHPMERSAPSPIPPPKDEDVSRQAMVSPEPGSPEVPRHAKLHKEKEKEKAAPGGFRKMFGRKNRASKVPDNAAQDLHHMMQSPEPEPEKAAPVKKPAAPAPASAPVAPRKKEPTPAPKAKAAPSPAPPAPVSAPVKAAPAPLPLPVQQPSTPVRNEEPTFEPAFEPDNVSRVDTADAQEAHREFARFDQGPLVDQPAFTPDSDNESDDATPPPIQRRGIPVPTSAADSPASPSNGDDGKAMPPVQDRWAQIRKNAAERAATRQSEEKSGGGQSKTTDGDDDDSTEETIESRVARIKARVAELTGNMEQVSGPGTSTPPPIRR